MPVNNCCCGCYIHWVRRWTCPDGWGDATQLESPTCAFPGSILGSWVADSGTNLVAYYTVRDPAIQCPDCTGTPTAPTTSPDWTIDCPSCLACPNCCWESGVTRIHLVATMTAGTGATRIDGTPATPGEVWNIDVYLTLRFLVVGGSNICFFTDIYPKEGLAHWEWLHTGASSSLFAVTPGGAFNIGFTIALADDCTVTGVTLAPGSNWSGTATATIIDPGDCTGACGEEGM